MKFISDSEVRRLVQQGVGVFSPTTLEPTIPLSGIIGDLNAMSHLTEWVGSCGTRLALISTHFHIHSIHHIITPDGHGPDLSCKARISHARLDS